MAICPSSKVPMERSCVRCRGADQRPAASSGSVSQPTAASGSITLTTTATKAHAMELRPLPDSANYSDPLRRQKAASTDGRTEVCSLTCLQREEINPIDGDRPRCCGSEWAKLDYLVCFRVRLCVYFSLFNAIRKGSIELIHWYGCNRFSISIKPMNKMQSYWCLFWLNNENISYIFTSNTKQVPKIPIEWTVQIFWGIAVILISLGKILNPKMPYSMWMCVSG